MGSNFDYTIVKKMYTPHELSNWFMKYQERLRVEHGSSYTGTLAESAGVDITNRTFVNRNIALDWISNNTEKFDSAKAVKLYNAKKIPQVLKNRKEKAEIALRNNEKKIKKLQRYTKKTGFKKCPKCNSLINMEYSGDSFISRCPICNKNNFYFSAAENKRLIQLKNQEKIIKKRIEMADKLIIEHAKKSRLQTFVWIIGGICSS